MSFNVTAGSRNITSTGPLKDLKSNVQSDFRLPNEVESYLDQPLSALPANLRSVGVDCVPGPSWSLGRFMFTLSAGVKSRLAVMLPGDPLLTFADEFQTDIAIGPGADAAPPPPRTIPVPAGQAYLCVELEFQIGGGISVEAPAGTVGICASASGQDTFGNAFYRKCTPSATLHDAIRDAFANYVLPLHPLTLANLDPGDYLHHEFNACLEVGLGASIGLSKVLYAAQAPASIPRMGGPIQALNMALPSFQACAKLAFSFAYTGAFEALLWKDNPSTGHMHLFRSREQDATLGLHLGVGLGSDAVHGMACMSQQCGALMGKVLPGTLAQKFIGVASDEMNNFAGEGCKKVASWLEPVNRGKATLDIAIESTKQSFLLLDYAFDLTAPAFNSAWQTALAGDFVAALTTPNGGVQIGAGGGLEKLYSKKTSVHLNLFGALNAVWSDATIHNTSMIYAGNNTFHLMAEEGRQQLALINNSKRQIDIYFAAQADFSGGTTKLGPVELHCVLKATNNPKYGKYLANFLNLMSPAAGQSALAQSIAALAAAPNTTEMVHLIFDQTSYGRLRASSLTNGKPDNEAPDQQNYAAFAQACSKLFAESPANFSYAGQSLGYTVWRNWNIASNNQWPAPPGAVPNRTASGNFAAGQSFLDTEFPQAGTVTPLIGYALQAASDFMSFCADLKSLSTPNSGGSATAAWDSLVARLKSIIQSDVSQDFAAPAGLALTWLCSSGNSPDEVRGPAPGLEDTNSIAVTVTFS
ncbi:MAG: hypothetical protein JOZ83_02880 [Silvibacterium sp.]|nr:hypothetical protein [Silvibacterium sp.]